MIRAVLIMAFCVVAQPVLANPEILAAVNSLRAEAGRAPVAYSTQLEALAKTHADDMARAGFFAHEGSDGSSLGDRAKRARYGFCFIAENIAKGQRSVAQVMQGWTDSRGHRRNMLDRRATEMGLARADGAIWVMVLGRPGC